MMLPRRPLGSSGMEITTLGLGAWAMGGAGWAFGWGPQDDLASIATIHHAIELGINWIDTAAVYGHGHSEEVVRRALAGIPLNDRPYVFTKCGLVWDEQDHMGDAVQNLQPESIRRECEASLRRLGVERLDLYQFHWPDQTDTPVEESWGEMTRLIDEGKLRAGGVSNFSVSLLERCEASRHVDALQPPFSLVRREAAAAEIPWCRAHDTGVIGYSPMESGLLTDRFTADRLTELSSLDWRRRGEEFQSPWPSGMRCVRSRNGTASPSARWPSPGPWHGLASPGLSSAREAPTRWTAGSAPPVSASPVMISPKSRWRSI